MYPICVTSSFLLLLFFTETFPHIGPIWQSDVDKFIQLVANICCTHVQVVSGINCGSINDDLATTLQGPPLMYFFSLIDYSGILALINF